METNEIFSTYSRIIGVDESGKGDFFGPLVVAAVLVKRDELHLISDWGIRDSKTLSDKQIRERAGKINEELCTNIVIINPRKYNELYGQFKNLNKLLAWAHARVIENILEKHNAEAAISDKFGNIPHVERALMEKGKKLTFISEVRAEKYISVACASIIARNAFINAMERLSKETGFPLSKGGGSTTISDGKKIIAKGLDLKDFAKMHFRNAKEIIGC